MHRQVLTRVVSWKRLPGPHALLETGRDHLRPIGDVRLCSSTGCRSAKRRKKWSVSAESRFSLARGSFWRHSFNGCRQDEDREGMTDRDPKSTRTLLSMQDLRWRALAEIRKQPGCSDVKDIAINRITDERTENNWSLCVPRAQLTPTRRLVPHSMSSTSCVTTTT